jgi:hypothetical protein
MQAISARPQLFFLQMSHQHPLGGYNLTWAQMEKISDIARSQTPVSDYPTAILVTMLTEQSSLGWMKVILQFCVLCSVLWITEEPPIWLSVPENRSDVSSVNDILCLENHQFTVICTKFHQWIALRCSFESDCTLISSPLSCLPGKLQNCL